MPTTYIWQQRLLRNESNDSNEQRAAQAQVRAFVEEGRLDSLLRDLRACGRDVQRMVDLIRLTLQGIPAEYRRAVALHVYRCTQGEGIINHAAESALGYV